MKTDREWILEAAQKAAGGTPLKRYTQDTISGAGFCAQLARETVEGGLGIPPNGWEVAQAALEHSRKRGGSVRWATDYEAAARALGLGKPADTMAPGDILYWPYRHSNGNNYGHTAVYLGAGLVLENTDARADRLVEKGARQPFGKGTQVFVTPLKLRGTPSTVAYPTLATRQAERPAPPVTSVPAVPQKPSRRVLVNNGQGQWPDVTGRKVTIQNAAKTVTVTLDDTTGLLLEVEADGLYFKANLSDPQTTRARFHRRK